ncbi:uncharacterized protein [Eleutherodactylus coqui]|uniref:uncharacterized protein n=1 Tax=Eleutherodactylus coqui TaxID=57060 RepID=UPI0034632AB9
MEEVCFLEEVESFFDTSIMEILDFLQEGLDKNLSPGNLEVQISALSCFLDQPLAEHKLVRKFAVIAHAEVEDCLVFLSMVGRFRKCEKFSGFLYGMLLLLTLAANCNGDVLELTKEMQHQAEILFNESVTEHEVFANRCKRHPNSTHKNSENLLNATIEALIYFREAFNLLFLSHTSEYKHKVKLEEAKQQIEELQYLLLNFLKSCNKSLEDVLTSNMQRVLRTKYDLPHSENRYEQKYECCQLINVYKEFLKVVRYIIEKISKKGTSKKCFKQQMTVHKKLMPLTNN